MVITLKKPEVETLKVNIGEATVEIPLGNSLAVEDFKALDTFEGTVAFYNKYIPENIARQLTFAEYNQITEAWTKATQEAARMSVGE